MRSYYDCKRESVSGSSTNKPVDESKRSGFDLVLSSVIDDSSTRLLTGAY